MGFFVIAHVIMPSDTPSDGTAGPHIPSTPLSTSSQSFTITLHLLLNSFLPFSLSLRSPIVSVRRTATVCIKSMAEKREKEETKLKVPETLSLCTPAIPAATSTISGSDEHRSSPDRSDLATGVVLESRSSTAISPKLPDLHKKRPLETVESSNDDDVKRLKRRDVNRCSGCRRKVGLMGFRCRCGEIFCSDHRYSDRHDCSYDYKAAGREAIARENPVVRAAKIVKV